jgi:hypothetical protein
LNTLSIPAIPSTIPTGYKIATDHSARSICAALHREGVLIDNDWRGSFGETLQSGLERFVRDDLHIHDLHTIHLNFDYSDSAKNDWAQGAIMIELTARRRAIRCIVSECITQLEKRARGAGYATLHSLLNALGVTVGRWSTTDAHEYLDGSDWYEQCLMEEIAQAEETGEKCQFYNPSLLELEKNAPAKAINPVWNEKAVRRALQKVDPVSWEHQALTSALEIKSLLPTGNERPDQLSQLAELGEWDFFVIPVLVAWQSTDCTFQVYDDNAENAWQAGDFCESCMAFLFHTEDPASVSSAIDRLRRSARLIRLADSILTAINTEKNIGKKYRPSVAARERWAQLWPDPVENDPFKAKATLMEILNEDDDQEFRTLI